MIKTIIKKKTTRILVRNSSDDPFLLRIGEKDYRMIMPLNAEVFDLSDDKCYWLRLAEIRHPEGVEIYQS